jgi:hypothetical protein
MTLGLEWLRLIALRFVTHGRRRALPRLDIERLSARDIADLNLPRSMLSRLDASEAEEQRRRVYR